MKSMRVLWESKTPVVSECFRLGRILPSANGGNAYDVQAALQLSNDFQVSMSSATVKRPGEAAIAYWARLRKLEESAEVVIREPYPIVFGRFRPGIRYIAMIHHIDDELTRKSVFHRWYFRRLKKRLAVMDLVVTVSEFWAGYLRAIGCKNVRVIYNAFDPTEFTVNPSAVAEFKSKYLIPSDRPVIYIGNASRQKGVYDVYQALKDKGYHLLMSGPQNHAPDLPVQYLQLERADYLLMLHACDAVVCMSRMREGWNRIAHEAMLCRVPVIGNGSGGMLELLQGGGQAIAKDSLALPQVVDNVLRHREEFAGAGYEYVSRFDLEYFKNQWATAVNSVVRR
jgi:glycosyltransferase involved in cell wall biosynthesis